MNEKKIELRDGGSVWLTTRPTYAQAKDAFRAQLRLSRFTGRDGQVRDDLTDEQKDQLEEFYVDAKGRSLRTYVTRWDNVRAPNGDELTFPDDIERMSSWDVDTVFEAIEGALREGRADPNAGRPSSGSTPPPGRSRQTRRKT